MEDIEKVKNMKYGEFMDYIRKNPKGTHVRDGIYNVSDIEFLLVNSKDKEATVVWIEAHDKFWIANAYETETIILLAEEPRKFEGSWDGSGFNYGSTNIITDCPKSIMILAEND